LRQESTARCTQVSRAILRNAFGSIKNDVVDGFTSRYGIHVLVHVEFHATMIDAITREKQIKKWLASLEDRAD
jgi:hypothetical protein